MIKSLVRKIVGSKNDRDVKQMMDKVGVTVDKKMCKKALRTLSDSGRLTYKYAGGSFVTLPEG